MYTIIVRMHIYMLYIYICICSMSVRMYILNIYIYIWGHVDIDDWICVYICISNILYIYIHV